MTRITTTVPGLFSVLLVGFLTVNVFAADPEPPTLGKSFHSDAIRFVAAISEDQQASTLIFDNFVVATAQGKGQLLSAETKSFTLGNQIEAKDAVTVTMDLRGFVATQDGGTAAVIVHAGQETTVVDLPRAIAAATSKPRKTDDPLYVQAQTDAERAGFDDRAPSKKSNDFSTRITVTLEKGQPLQATVVLLTDRQPNADSSALVVVDSIDVSVKAAPAPKKTEQKSASPKLTLVSGEKETAETKSAEKKPAEKKTARKKATEKKDAGDSMTSKPADAPKSAPKDTESKASPKKAVKEKSDSKAEEKKAADTKKSGA